MTVADSGFHSASVPSQTGIVSVGANVLVTIVTGNITVWTMARAAAPVNTRPIHIPAHSIAKRRSRSSPIAATTSAGPVCQRQPRTSPHTIITASPSDA